MNKLYDIIRSLGYTTSGETSELVDAIKNAVMRGEIAMHQAAAAKQEESCRMRICCRADAHAEGCTTYDPSRYPDKWAAAEPVPTSEAEGLTIHDVISDWECGFISADTALREIESRCDAATKPAASAAVGVPWGYAMMRDGVMKGYAGSKAIADSWVNAIAIPLAPAAPTDAKPPITDKNAKGYRPPCCDGGRAFSKCCDMGCAADRELAAMAKSSPQAPKTEGGAQ